MIKTIDELIRQLEEIKKEFGVHPKLEGGITFWFGDKLLELEYVEIDRNMGCRCPIGAELNFTEVKD